MSKVSRRHQVTLPVRVLKEAGLAADDEVIIRVVGPLLVVIGLFWFAHGAGLLTSPYNAAVVDYGLAVVAAGFAIVWLGWQ